MSPWVEGYTLRACGVEGTTILNNFLPCRLMLLSSDCAKNAKKQDGIIVLINWIPRTKSTFSLSQNKISPRLSPSSAIEAKELWGPRYRNATITACLHRDDKRQGQWRSMNTLVVLLKSNSCFCRRFSNIVRGPSWSFSHVLPGERQRVADGY